MTKSKPHITLASIVAIAKNRAIGKNGGMIWHIPKDLKHFKRTTLGKPVIMGRKSYESLGKPLPGRTNIVISRSSEVKEGEETQIYKDMEASSASSQEATNPTELRYVRSIEESITLGKEIARASGVDEIFITGGGQIYAETLPYTERLYLTTLDREYEGDTFFPEVNWDEWNIKFEEKHTEDLENDRPSFTFYTLQRKT